MKTQFDDWLESDEAFESLHKDQRDAMRDAFTAGWSKGYEEAQKDAAEEATTQ